MHNPWTIQGKPCNKRPIPGKFRVSSQVKEFLSKMFKGSLRKIRNL